MSATKSCVHVATTALLVLLVGQRAAAQFPMAGMMGLSGLGMGGGAMGGMKTLMNTMMAEQAARAMGNNPMSRYLAGEQYDMPDNWWMTTSMMNMPRANRASRYTSQPMGAQPMGGFFNGMAQMAAFSSMQPMGGQPNIDH